MYYVLIVCSLSQFCPHRAPLVTGSVAGVPQLFSLGWPKLNTLDHSPKADTNCIVLLRETIVLGQSHSIGSPGHSCILSLLAVTLTCQNNGLKQGDL